MCVKLSNVLKIISLNWQPFSWIFADKENRQFAKYVLFVYIIPNDTHQQCWTKINILIRYKDKIKCHLLSILDKNSRQLNLFHRSIFFHILSLIYLKMNAMNGLRMNWMNGNWKRWTLMMFSLCLVKILWFQRIKIFWLLTIMCSESCFMDCYGDKFFGISIDDASAAAFRELLLFFSTKLSWAWKT